VIPGCAHWIAEEQPERLLEALFAFFAEDESEDESEGAEEDAVA